MNTRTDRCLVVVVVVVSTLVALFFPGCAKKTGVMMLVAAMPREVESIYYRDFTRMTGPAWMLNEAERTEHEGETDSIYGAAVSAAWSASPTAQVFGASEFTKLQGIGSNTWDQRDIFVCRDSLTPFREKLAGGSALVVGKTRHGSVEVFEGRRTMRSFRKDTPDQVVSIFVAIPDDHTLVISESRAEVETMVDALLDRAISGERLSARVRERWGDIGEVVAGEPTLLVLRAVEPEAIDRWLSRPSDARRWPPTHAVAMTRRGELSALDLRYVGPAKELPRSWVEFVFADTNPERSDSPGGFMLKSSVFFNKQGSEPREALYLWMLPRLVFGQQVAF